MAIQRYNRYQYETSPRKIEPEYRQERKKYPKKSTAPKKHKNTSKETIIRKRDRVKVVVALAAVFASVFAISYRNSKIDEAFSKSEELKQAYLAVEKENDQMEVDIENSLNLSNLEQEAKEQLGMQKLTAKQTVYVNLPKKDYIQAATESIVIDEDESLWDKIINKFKEIIS